MSIHCLVFDDAFNQKEFIQFVNAKFSRHIFDTQQFTMKVSANANVVIGDIITLIEERSAIFSGVVTGYKRLGNQVDLTGYNLKFFLDGIMYFDLHAVNPVAVTNVQNTNIATIQEELQTVFPDVSLSLESGQAIPRSFNIEIRLKSIGEFLRDISVTTDCFYDFFAVGNKTIKLVIKSIRDLRADITLLTNITHSELEKVINIKEKYNQIIGLGAGEGATRDYHFINNNLLGDYAKCYVYDVRDGDLTHTELVRQTENKMKELQYDYQSKFKVLENNVYQLGRDYDMGDIVTFKDNDGELFDDLISSLEYEVVNGRLKQNYEVTTGLLKGNLTDKIKELKEGGYQ